MAGLLREVPEGGGNPGISSVYLTTQRLTICFPPCDSVMTRTPMPKSAAVIVTSPALMPVNEWRILPPTPAMETFHGSAPLGSPPGADPYHFRQADAGPGLHADKPGPNAAGPRHGELTIADSVKRIQPVPFEREYVDPIRDFR